MVEYATRALPAPKPTSNRLAKPLLLLELVIMRCCFLYVTLALELVEEDGYTGKRLFGFGQLATSTLVGTNCTPVTSLCSLSMLPISMREH